MSTTIRNAFEILESRRLFDATLEDGLLLVEGTDGEDTITVTRDGNQIEVEVNDDDVESFAVGDVDRLRILGLEDDDFIDVGRGIIGATIVGGDGSDDISGGENGDLIRGGLGFDTLSGAQGPDTIRGGDGADYIVGGNGEDVLSGGAEDDDLAGGEDNDRIFGNVGYDTITGGDGADRLNGGDDDDRFWAFDGNRDTILAGEGNDIAKIDDPADLIDGDLEASYQKVDFLGGYAVVIMDGDEDTRIVTFGGNGTLEVTIDWTETGKATLTFDGIFPSGISPDAVGALVSTNFLGTVNVTAQVTDASPDQIVVDVWTWEDADTFTDVDFTITLYLHPDGFLVPIPLEI